jgi:ATP-dependent helicase/nuclease subunit B
MIDKPVINTVLSALEAALGGFSQSDVLRYLKSLLSPVDLDLADRMENYAVLWSVDGKRWLTSWEEHPYGLGKEWTDNSHSLLERLNDGRQKAIAPLSRLRDDFRSAISVRDQVSAVYRFLKDIKLESRLRFLAQKMETEGQHTDSQVLNQLWDILIGALEQVYDVLAETVWESDTFTRLLKLLLSQYDVGTIPSVLDAVTVGSVSSMRCHKTKHLFLIGASEGALPSYAAASGILNDQERSLLIKMGLTLNPGTIDGLQTQFSEIHEVLSSAEETITLSYSAGQPSYIYDRIKTMVNAEETVCDALGAAATDPLEAASYLICRDQHTSADLLHIEEEISIHMDYNGILENGKLIEFKEVEVK